MTLVLQRVCSYTKGKKPIRSRYGLCSAMDSLFAVQHSDVCGNGHRGYRLSDSHDLQPKRRLACGQCLLLVGGMVSPLDDWTQSPSARHGSKRRSLDRRQTPILFRYHCDFQLPGAVEIHHEATTAVYAHCWPIRLSARMHSCESWQGSGCHTQNACRCCLRPRGARAIGDLPARHARRARRQESL